MGAQDREHGAAETRPPTADGGTTIGRDAPAVELSRLARESQDAPDLEASLRDIVTGAVELVPGVEEGAVAEVIRPDRIRERAASGYLPALVDHVMVDVGEGPCLDAVWQHKTVRVTDMSRESRWPRFAPRAAALGAASMLSFQLFVTGDSMAALTLYSSRPRAFTDESEHVGMLFAAHAAVAYAGTQELEQLRAAMETRDLIGQAMGIMMERFNLTADQAFATLARFSQDAGRELRDVATEIIGDAEAGARRHRLT
ncbi:GAF domain-containing protein [Kribbella amoyensis]|uniref:GAF domain-containing protein n=1 Tax=Kribbella amoyensis TaxID=996641 RepID=A0A561BZL7_9ACTN|nr:GAF and ANTAR domain-containing protein [Kribbella amoyensis]TWD84122.1 GAF domain-containing protein [Kribbella amoyensis]